MQSKRTRHQPSIFSRFLRRYWKRSSSVEASGAAHSHFQPSTSEQYRECHHHCPSHNTNSTFTIQESDSSNYYLLSKINSQDYSASSSTNNFPNRPQIALIIKDSEPEIQKIYDANILFTAATATCLMDSNTHIITEITDDVSPVYTRKLISLKNMATQVPSSINDVNDELSEHPVIIDASISAKPISEQEIRTGPPQERRNFTQANLAYNIDQRYGGQYYTVEQLPEFCEQLRHLVEMIKNIQSYATITGEYPSALEKRLQQESREVGALAAEVRNARDTIERARTQRRAVRALRKEIVKDLVALRDEEIRVLENSVRVADRTLFKSWENLKEAIEVHAFDGLRSDIKEKQNALENLSRLIDNRCVTLQLLASSASHTPRTPVLPLSPSSGLLDKSPRSRYYLRKKYLKRKCREREIPSNSVPVSNEPSIHSNRDYNQNPNSTVRSVNSVISNQTARNSININPMTVPYEFVSQSGIPANMLPSMGSNSNHNLALNLTLVPFRHGTGHIENQSLEVILPQEWQVLPEATLTTELLWVVTNQKPHQTSIRVCYTGVAAESSEFDGLLWFKKSDDNNTEPDFNSYALLTIPSISSASTQDDSSYSESDSEQLLSDDGPCSTCDELDIEVN